MIVLLSYSCGNNTIIETGKSIHPDSVQSDTNKNELIVVADTINIDEQINLETKNYSELKIINGINETRVYANISEFTAYYDSIIKLNNVKLDLWPDTNFTEGAFFLLSKMNNLKYLRLHFSPENDYVAGLDLLTNVNSLELSNFNAKYFDDLCKLKSLKELRFEPIFIELDNFPQQFYELDNLEVLVFCLGDIGEIPSDIAKLSNLKVLKSMKTNVTKLPPEIGQMDNLEKLIIAGRYSLDSIPKEISDIKNLKTLILWKNRLSYLPSELSDLNNLEFLNIGDNKFTEDEKDIVSEMFPDIEIVYNNSYPHE